MTLMARRPRCCRGVAPSGEPTPEEQMHRSGVEGPARERTRRPGVSPRERGRSDVCPWS